MATKFLPNAAATLLLTLLATGCGGGGGDGDSGPSAPPDPPAQSHALKLEILTGKFSVDHTNCQSANGPAAVAQFSNLIRATVYKDAVYLAETGEGCSNVSYSEAGFVPNKLGPAIRKLSDGAVETAVGLNDYVPALSHPIMVRYPSAIYHKESTGENFVLGVAATLNEGFRLDESEVSRYTDQGGWNYYVPGLFRFTQNYAEHDNLVAGAPGKPPALSDGIGQASRFVAPHDLEVDSAGLFYLIDDGYIRTIDENFKVTTLDHAAMGITHEVKALDADHKKNIHVLTQRYGPSYTWHRLADGSRVDFEIRSRFFTPVPPTLETFTVIGDDIILGVRTYSYFGSATELFRISATGVVTELSGSAQPTTPQEFLDAPSRYQFPQVQHLEYGVDGHLYMVLPQGVLIARNYN